MSEISRRIVRTTLLALLVAGLAYSVAAQQPPPKFNVIQGLENHESFLSFDAHSGHDHDIQVSTDLAQWNTWVTLLGTNTETFTFNFLTPTNQVYGFIDTAAPFVGTRFYRAVQRAETNAIPGDHLRTDQGEDVVFAPIHHGTLVMKWGLKTIYSDPVGGASLFQKFPPPDLILITHIHPDHFDTNTLNAVKGPNTQIVAPQNVFQAMPSTLQSITKVMANGATASVSGISIEAAPAYNTTSDRLIYHPKGRDNGYVLTLGGKRVYISGDTEDIPEMRALRNIDVAFVSMNPPFTMDVTQAASAVREFKPRIVYPYHFNAPTVRAGGVFDPSEPMTQDVFRFKEIVGTGLGIEVRLRRWYANQEIGDTLPAEQGGIAIRALNHCTVLMTWAKKTIYCDPSGGAAIFQGFPKADLILVTHIHNDHFDTNSIPVLMADNTAILAPPSVVAAMPVSLQNNTLVMTNGSTANLLSLSVEAVPAYNTTPGRTLHPKGRDNGYVLTLGGKRIYISGDTEDIPEMRALKKIDVAFLCMIVPSNMDVEQAASAVRAFKPSVVYPYHFFNARAAGVRGSIQDITRLKTLIGNDLGTEVRLRPWYINF